MPLVLQDTPRGLFGLRGVFVVMTRAQIAELFDRYGPLVQRRALVLLRDPHEAEEATQEIFMRVLRASGGFQGRSRASTWLYQITTNYCLDRLRGAARRRELWEQNVDSAPPLPAGAPPAEDLLMLRQLLSEADEAQARAAVYVFVDGMSHEEAAEILGVSRRTVGNLIERFTRWARARLETREAG